MNTILHFSSSMYISNAREVHWTLSSSIDWYVEQAWVLALDSQLKVVEFNLTSKGTVNYCQIHPRDIFRFVISRNASSFILAHNHPSGNALPSVQDIQFTKRILKLSQLHEIPLLDHVILTKTGATSMRALKNIKNWT